ncbi:hypothetical protein F5883DRAFT_651855 [Diaporthe sp. PMI_573]|nr:hypothetical protein F5883DRAFT_651855 [Diaporthaceae sp. PMI_573]
MAGNTPWASQMFPVPTQESVPASMLTGDESYSIKLVNFSKALTQLPDTQGPNQETQAVEGEEAARTADRAEGQQSLCPGHGRQHDDTRTLVAAEGTNTAGREVPRVEEPAQKAAQEVEGRPQNPPPGTKKPRIGGRRWEGAEAGCNARMRVARGPLGMRF